MAAATATLKVDVFPKGVDNTQRRTIIHGICALSAGGTYVTNGIPLNWGTMQDANLNNTTNFIIPNVGPTQTQPDPAYFFSKTGATGYTYVYDGTHNTLRIWNGGTELANAASITADTIGFEAEFQKQV